MRHMWEGLQKVPENVKLDNMNFYELWISLYTHISEMRTWKLYNHWKEENHTILNDMDGTRRQWIMFNKLADTEREGQIDLTDKT